MTRFATAAGNGTSSAEGGVANVPLTDLGQLDLTQLIDDLANTNIAASALGPLVLAETVNRTGSYASIFYLLAVVVTGLALLAWLVTTPNQSTSA